MPVTGSCLGAGPSLRARIVVNAVCLATAISNAMNFQHGSAVAGRRGERHERRGR